MIKYISSADLIVSQTGAPGPYGSGVVFWDGNQQKFKVVNGERSEDLHGATVNISFNVELQEMKNWINKKKVEEAELDDLCKKYPNLDEARNEYEMLRNLLKEHK